MDVVYVDEALTIEEHWRSLNQLQTDSTEMAESVITHKESLLIIEVPSYWANNYLIDKFSLSS